MIEKRLDNWFVCQSQSTVQFTGNVKKRWDSLQGDVDDAHTEFAALIIAKSMAGVITGIVRQHCLHLSIVLYIIIEYDK